ncbi:type II toxin-antitoxin system Phd/YefM family antitoxin [Spirillospora sp. NBC_00431]
MKNVDVPVTEARAQFADLVNRVAYTGEPVKLTRRGRVMAALVSPEDLELLEMIRSQRVDLSQSAQSGQGAQQARPAERPQPSPSPLRIAAEYRPPGFGR